MALFGGNKGSSATRTNKAEELEADLLSAIEGVQGRGRYGWNCCASVGVPTSILGKNDISCKVQAP